jgi:hypothetical protein
MIMDIIFYNKAGHCLKNIEYPNRALVVMCSLLPKAIKIKGLVGTIVNKIVWLLFH